jgi:hypothetical protein
MDLEKRIIDIFEIIAHNGIEGTLNFRQHRTPQSFALEDAQRILDPRLTQLAAQVNSLCQRRSIDDALINNLAAAEAVSAYVIGILAGLDLAKRADIAGKFAKMYAETTREHIDLLFGSGRKSDSAPGYLTPESQIRETLQIP